MAVLLTENDVVDAIAAHLRSQGDEVLQALHAHQKGIDIIARVGTPPQLMHLEAKGETSARPTSAGYGKLMDSAAIRINLTEAFYTAAITSTMRDGSAVTAAIGLPDNALYRRYHEPLRPALAALAITTYWVYADHGVAAEGVA